MPIDEISLDRCVLSGMSLDDLRSLDLLVREELAGFLPEIGDRELAAMVSGLLDDLPDDPARAIRITVRELTRWSWCVEPPPEDAYTIDAADQVENGEHWTRIARVLSRFGFVIVRNHVDADAAGAMLELSRRIERRYAPCIGAEEDVVTEDFYYRSGKTPSPLNTYAELSTCPKAVIMPRTPDYDRGVVDIFNYDLLSSEVREFADRHLRSGEIRKGLETAFGQSYEARNLNLYDNDNSLGIEGYSTRDFHFDGFRMAKSFVYLTDVPDPSFGPYTYLPGSHRGGILHRLNEAVMRRMPWLGWVIGDLKLIDRHAAVPCVGPSGTLVISSQGGAHRGMRQHRGRHRRLLVQAFFVSDGG